MAITCGACGEDVGDDQTVVRLTAGVGTSEGTFAGIFRPDVYLHAGLTTTAWGEPSGERWCATDENLRKALWALYLDATTGASGSYGGE